MLGQSHQILGQSHQILGQSHQILGQSHQILGQSHQILGQPLLTSYENTSKFCEVHASRDYYGNGRQLPYRSTSPAQGLHAQVCLIEDCMIVDLYSLRIKLWREWGTV
jgi:hypothetical protein